MRTSTADSTTQRNRGVMSCRSHVFKPKVTSSKQVAAHPAFLYLQMQVKTLLDWRNFRFMKFLNTKLKQRKTYCWPITQAKWRPRCGRSGFSVCPKACTSTEPLCIYVYSWPYVHSIPTCAKFDFRGTSQNVTVA